MKFRTTTYHNHLLGDVERLSVFYEAISDYAKTEGIDKRFERNEDDSLINSVVYDLGCGSGILSYFASLYFNSIVGFEKNEIISGYASENLESCDNVIILNADILKLEGLERGNLIICEMMDTALIDEEEIPVLNHFRKFMDKDSRIIPKEVVNFAEPVNMDSDYVSWEDYDSDLSYDIIGDSVRYSDINLNEYVDEEFEKIISFKISEDSVFNGIKITSSTILTDNIVCGHTPMFNPPLLIPVDGVKVKKDETIKVKLEYIMGGGIETIKTDIVEQK